jgi:hypothetical protein
LSSQLRAEAVKEAAAAIIANELFNCKLMNLIKKLIK